MVVESWRAVRSFAEPKLSITLHKMNCGVSGRHNSRSQLLFVPSVAALSLPKPRWQFVQGVLAQKDTR